mgnify:FL=1|tara:strand:- start:19 stop:438 length:420 start_codon:yes stop_codon:yes gene_type:complete
MTTRFENKNDLNRENKSCLFFCNLYNYTFEKLGDNDIDFKIYDKDKNFIFYLEVKGRLKKISDAYPLPVAIRKLLKMSDKKKQGVILWSCDDGIIFSRIEKLKGDIKQGGRKPRNNSANDIELMAYYKKQKNLIEIKFK